MNFLAINVAIIATLASVAAAADPIYSADFEKQQAGAVPQELMVLSGTFAVKEESGNKFLELPGAPLDSFGLLFGPTPSELASLRASGRFFGTKQGRKNPTFGLSLSGVAGYRLQMSPNKKALELYKGDEARATAPYEWTSGAWTKLRIQIRKTSSGWRVEGRAWAADATEPNQWLVAFEDTEEPPLGRAGIWGSPFSGTPLRFDDLVVERGE